MTSKRFDWDHFVVHLTDWVDAGNDINKVPAEYVTEDECKVGRQLRYQRSVLNKYRNDHPELYPEVLKA